MLIGLVYDLRSDYLEEGYTLEETAEFDRPDTIDAIESALRELGHETDRVGRAKELARRLSGGARWDLIFNIAEGMHGIGREAQVPALLEMHRIPYTFSDAAVMAVSLHKGFAKRIVRSERIPTADFVEIKSPKDIKKVFLPFPLFIKPLAEGTGKGVDGASVIRRPEDLEPRCRALLERFKQPVLAETYLSGREFTVSILGTGEKARVLGTLEVALLDSAEQGAYSYENKEKCEELVEYRLAQPGEDEEVRLAEEMALASWRVLGCRDAGRVDLRSDENGIPHFMEVNPLAGLHPHHSDLPILCSKIGMPYVELIDKIVRSASRRIEGHPSQDRERAECR